MKPRILFLLAAISALPVWADGVIPAVKKKLHPSPPPSAVDQYVREAEGRATVEGAATTTGSTWASYSAFSDLTRDLRASRVDDVVTVIVAESASAVTSGGTQTARKSSANAAITGFPGIKGAAATAALGNLTKLSSDTSLNGSGSTTRSTTLNTNLTARVVNVLPNGFLVIEGSKNVQINSEWQTVTVRGVIRPADLTADNTVPSQRIAQLEVKLDGKGVINDAIRRPNFLYRLLLGVLPF
jgi:flagellar L-ring protein precursor FlgH